MATGFAIVTKDGIDIDTVSATQRGAKERWLRSALNFHKLRSVDDDTIDNLFRTHSRLSSATCVPVIVHR